MTEDIVKRWELIRLECLAEPSFATGRRWILICVTAWALCVFLGVSILLREESLPGSDAGISILSLIFAAAFILACLHSALLGARFSVWAFMLASSVYFACLLWEVLHDPIPVVLVVIIFALSILVAFQPSMRLYQKRLKKIYAQGYLE